MYTTTTKEYKKMLETCYDRKVPMMVYGGFGIGKSQIPRQVFKKIADEKGKEFVVWEDTTHAQKNEMIANADKYFVFCDQRVGQMDSTDLRGIPNMMDTDKLQTIPYAWVVYFTTEGADGVLFLDELNLAPPTVAGSAYQIINDRAISDRTLAKDVFCMGAGNRAQDKAHIFEMPMPLHDRFAEVEIGVNVADWVEWASANVNPHLVSFIQWRNDLLYKVDVKKGDKPSTPRAVERASTLLGDMDISTNEAYSMVAIACGEAFAIHFQAYAKYHSQLNWESLYKEPRTVQKFELDKMWAVAGGMADQFLKGVDAPRFDEMLAVTMEMKPDFRIVCLKMMKEGNKKKFMKQMQKSKACAKVLKTSAKFLIES